MKNSTIQTKFYLFFAEICYLISKWVSYIFTLGLGIYALYEDWDKPSVMKNTIFITYIFFQFYQGILIQFKGEQYKQKSILNLALLFFDVLILLKTDLLWIYILTIWIISWGFMVDYIFYSKKLNKNTFLKQMWQIFVIFMLPVALFLTILNLMIFFGETNNFLQVSYDVNNSLGMNILGLLGHFILYCGKFFFKSFIENIDSKIELKHGQKIFF